MNIGFDVISDLYLTPEDNFNWEGKATSLYCIIAGNVSNDLKTIRKTLSHLGQYYQGVFYCLGSLEYEDCDNIDARTKELSKICNTQRNAVLLHHHVVIVESVAILGVNGWYGNTLPTDPILEMQLEVLRNEDIIYLKSSLDKLQRHLDVKSIILVSNSVPNDSLYFGQDPLHAVSQLPIDIALIADTEKKVTHWAYGTYDKVVDVTIDNINYVNNSSYKRLSYYPKRIES
jgi:predicted phosphohydrolase